MAVSDFYSIFEKIFFYRMKRTLLACMLLLAFAGSGRAQITLGTNDFSFGGDTFRVSNALPFIGMDLNGSPNYTWDYSQLNMMDQEIIKFIPSSQWPLPLLAVFAFSANQATYSPINYLDTLGIPVTGTYNMLNNTSTAFVQRGTGLETPQGTLPVQFSPPDVIYKYPVAMGNVDSSSSGYTINQLPGIFFRTVKKRVNTVDGWGMLTTPFGTFSVLRIQSVINQHDSIVIDSLGLNFGLDLPEQVEYKWLGQDQGMPLLQVNTSAGLPVQVVYRDSARMLISVPEVAVSDFQFEVFPNPASEHVIVKYTLEKPADVAFEILDASGKLVYAEEPIWQSAGEKMRAIVPRHSLATGNYFLRLTADGKQEIRKLVISK
jgi:hypothetical protein